MKCSLVIPCYNEASGLPTLIARCREVTAVGGLEIIFVDNGSTDNTSEILLNLLTNIESCQSTRVSENRGYGFGILAGLKLARGDVVGWTHADMQTDPMDVLHGLDIFSKSNSPNNLFVKGRRVRRPFGDWIFTIGMSGFETLLLGKVLSDINAQPTLFPRSFYESWIDPPHDFSIDLYAYAMAKQQGLEVRRFPVFFGERRHGQSSWNVDLRAKYKFIKRTFDYSFQLRRNLKIAAKKMG